MKYLISERQYNLIKEEEVNPRLKKIIFNKLLEDMKDAEIIEDPKNDSIWAIDPENKYWYFELEKDGVLRWRWKFFENFFKLFSMEQEQYEPLIRSMVEDLLNRKVKTSTSSLYNWIISVEDLLNRKVKTSAGPGYSTPAMVGDLLNRIKK